MTKSELLIEVFNDLCTSVGWVRRTAVGVADCTLLDYLINCLRLVCRRITFGAVCFRELHVY